MTRGGFATVIAAVVLAGAASARADLTATTDAFCSDLQRIMTATTVDAANVVHGDFDSFVKSKAEIRPLRTEQFVLFEDAEKQRPMRVSCKLKTPDLVQQEYGANAAGEAIPCGEVNKRIVAAAAEGLAAEQRTPRIAPSEVTFDPDEMVMAGTKWIEPYPFAYTTADGRLHVKAKGLRIDWSNKLFALAPDRFRGTLYCHLIAPEYAKRLLTGEAAAPAATATGP